MSQYILSKKKNGENIKDLDIYSEDEFDTFCENFKLHAPGTRKSRSWRRTNPCTKDSDDNTETIAPLFREENKIMAPNDLSNDYNDLKTLVDLLLGDFNDDYHNYTKKSLEDMGVNTILDLKIIAQNDASYNNEALNTLVDKLIDDPYNHIKKSLEN